MSGKRQCEGTREDGQRCTRSWEKSNKRFCQDHRNQSRQRTSRSGTNARSPAVRASPGRPKVVPTSLPPPSTHRAPTGASLLSPSAPPPRTGAKRHRTTTATRAKYPRAAGPSGIDTDFRANALDGDGSYERPGDRLLDDSPSRRRWRPGHWLGTFHRRTASNRRTARERAKHSLVTDSLAIDTDVVTYVFDRDGFYERLADRLLDSLPLHRRLQRGHWLCRRLNESAHIVDPNTYAEQVQKPTRDGLMALGFPKFIATVLGASAGLGLKIALGHTPMGHLTSALRVLIALVCPNLDRCPTKQDVMETFASPVLGEYLKEMAGESVH